MGALDDFTEWERRLSPDGLAPLPLEEIYDPATVEAIEQRRGQPSTSSDEARHPRDETERRGPRPPSRAQHRPVRERAVSGAMVVSMLRGIEAALDDGSDAIEDFALEPADTRLEPVSIVLVPGDPAASVAIVRPWLFSRKGG